MNDILFFYNNEKLYDVLNVDVLFTVSNDENYKKYLEILNDKLICKIKFVCKTNLTKLKYQIVSNDLFITKNYLYINQDFHKRLPFEVDIPLIRNYYFEIFQHKDIFDFDFFIEYKTVNIKCFDYERLLNEICEDIQKRNNFYITFLNWVYNLNLMKRILEK